MGGHTPEPDDYSEGRLDEQKEMRERQVILMGRLCSLVPFEFEMMQILAGLFDQLDPKTSPQNHAEVPLSLMIVLAQELPPRSKEISEDNNYYAMILYILNKDLLNTWPCIYQNAFPTEKFMEMIYRWSFFFKGLQFTELV